MKKILTSIAFIVILQNSFAQYGPSESYGHYKNMIRTSISQFTLSTFHISYERFIKPAHSLYFSPSFHFVDRTFEQSWGAKMEVQYRYHAFIMQNEMSSSRVYFAPYIYDLYMFEKFDSFLNSNSTERVEDYYNVMSGGILVGLSYSFAGRINADIFAGGGIRKAFGADSRTDGELFQPAFSGISPRFGLEFGFWF